jgi:hypothetical protein
LITADYSQAVRDAAQASGYPLLNKPLRPAALRALMAQLLTETRGRRGALAESLGGDPVQRAAITP